jgi:hypothetical protein
MNALYNKLARITSRSVHYKTRPENGPLQSPLSPIVLMSLQNLMSKYTSNA